MTTQSTAVADGDQDDSPIEEVDREIALAAIGPDVSDAPEPATEPTPVDDSEMRAAEWLSCAGLRRRLHEDGIVRCVGPYTADVHGKLMRLERSGYARQVGKHAYALTPEGRNTLDWAGSPKPANIPEKAWAGELSRAIAAHYSVEVHAMLRTGRHGVALRARSRLCYALYARGWTVDRISQHFGMGEESVRTSIARWRTDRARLHSEVGS